MILEKENTQVDTPLEGKTFKIEDNVVLYNILSDRMYKNKVRAVIRELSTNAVDAQIEAGNLDTPIKVQLPTILEPTFSIRDYGIGLSSDDVMDLYTTYGSSTKRDSNLFNGALGLGSKSPFAYSKAFSVTSYFNGVKHMFSVYSDNGLPKIAKLGEEKTDEPNGLLVSIPTEDKDLYKFQDEAKFVYQWFDFPIECNQELKTPVSDLTANVARDNWAIYDEVSGSHIVMANVAYKLSGLEIAGCDMLNTEGLVVHVGIGDVQFSASREELSLTPDTVAYLVNLSSDIEQGLEDEVAERIGTGDTSVKDVMRLAKSLPKMLRKKVGEIYKQISVSYYGDVTVNIPKGFKVKTRPSWTNRYERISQLNERTVNGTQFRFIFNDVKNRMAHIKDVDTHSLIFVDSEEDKTKENSKSRFDAFINELGLTPDQYRYATDYELPKRIVVNRVVKDKTQPKERLIDHKRVLSVEYDKEKAKWVTTIISGIPDLALSSKEYKVYSMIEVRNDITDEHGRYLIYGSGALQSVFKYNKKLDKDKKYLFVVQTPSQHKKYNKDIKHLWTDLLPKNITYLNVRAVIDWFVGLKIQVSNSKDTGFVFRSEVRTDILPKDLLNVLAKINKQKIVKVDSMREIREISNLRSVAQICGKTLTVNEKFFDMSKVIKKYDSIHGNMAFGYGTSTQKYRALILLAWHKSYNKLKDIK